MNFIRISIEIIILLALELLNAIFLVFNALLILLYAIALVMTTIPTPLSDPTLPDIAAPITFVALLNELIRLGCKQAFTERNKKHFSRSFIRIYLLAFIFPSIDIAMRHIGVWGELKSELISLNNDIKNFEAEHGPISSSESMRQFNSVHPGKSFTVSGGQVLYTAYWDPQTYPRVGVTWDRGGTARFDLTTMFVLYTD